ncbi:MAG: heme lyase CcmF/NrfE family subunit, partial [Deltaproteobacteria bacterium]|nr:heme lyase CcmF/NrfE family subunit [Deltaproteobacteria bacterium]
MSELGFSALVICFVLAGYSVFASVLGHRLDNGALVESGRRSAYAVTGLLTLSILLLFYAFVMHDFSLKFVADHSNKALSWNYAAAALWSGQQGSLLLWVWILSLYTAAVVYWNRGRYPELMPYVTAVLAVIIIFFVLLLLFVANPFEKLLSFNVPRDGRGLNPLLQHPAMMIHPPCLYLGFVGVAVPFAFSMAALLTRRLDDSWIRATRRWMLFPWMFLGLGILLGGRWAYVELGWGGYWAWDPVENASLMPWLAGTAYLHSVMIQEKRDIMRFWSHFLVTLTFLLAILGTFITRSGLVSSVHSFAQSPIGPFFLGFIIFTTLAAVIAFWVRRRELQSKSSFDSYLSRESSFLLNNLVLLGACFAVLWGTLFPMLSEAVRGVRVAVGPPWFNQVNVPIALLLLALTGIGPLVAWRRASPRNLRRMFAIPVFIGVAGALLLRVLGITHFYALISFGLSMFVLAGIVQEFWRGTRARRRQFGESTLTALSRLFRKNRRRYGGYVVHVGMVAIFVGITGTAFNSEREATLNQGETVEVGKYTLRYQGVESGRDANHEWAKARFEIFEGTRLAGVMVPAKNFYLASQQPTTEVAIRSSLREDLYLALAAVSA